MFTNNPMAHSENAFIFVVNCSEGNRKGGLPFWNYGSARCQVDSSLAEPEKANHCSLKIKLKERRLRAPFSSIATSFGKQQES
jgi:hypothetical protein